MHWNTLKIAAVVALLASPSAFAATPGAGALDGGASTVEAPQLLQLADHRGHTGRPSNRWLNNGRPRETRGDGSYNRHDQRPDYRGHPSRHFRGHPPRHFRGHPPRRFRGHPPRRFRGWPIRRHFRHWWRHY